MTEPVEVSALPALDVASRIPKLRQKFTTAVETSGKSTADGADAIAPGPIDGLVVTKLEHLRYLFGFTGSAGLGWIGRDEAVLITDGRYRHQAAAELEAAGVSARLEISRTPRPIFAAAAEDACAEVVGLEAAHVSWQSATSYRGWFEGVDLAPTIGLVEGLRAVKDAGELARIEAAAKVADAALAEVRTLLVQGPTEAEVAQSLEQAMVAAGASGAAYDTIVASGPNGANPHARAGSRRIEAGDLVVIDVGAVVDGYRSDMTRTFSIGEPDDLSRRMLEVVTEAQAGGVEMVRAGVAAADVDKRCRDRIAEAGWAEAFEHGTGHGVGLDIHEAPSVNSRTQDVLLAGHVVTVEPGVYLAGHGGVRVEDLVVVTEAGARVLSQSPKDPVLAVG